MQRNALHIALESQNYFAILKLPYFLNVIFRSMHLQHRLNMSLSLNFRDIPLDVETMFVIHELHSYAEQSLQERWSVKRCLQHQVIKPFKMSFWQVLNQQQSCRRSPGVNDFQFSTVLPKQLRKFHIYVDTGYCISSCLTAMLSLIGSLCNLKRKGMLFVVSRRTPQTMVGTLFLRKFPTVLASRKTKRVPAAV